MHKTYKHNMYTQQQYTALLYNLLYLLQTHSIVTVQYVMTGNNFWIFFLYCCLISVFLDTVEFREYSELNFLKLKHSNLGNDAFNIEVENCKSKITHFSVR